MIFYVNFGKLSDEDHKKVVRFLNSDQTIRDWIHCLESSWLVDSNQDSSTKLREKLEKIFGEPLCLIISLPDNYSGRLDKAVWAWANKKQLPAAAKQPDAKSAEEQQGALASIVEISRAKDLRSYMGLGVTTDQIATMIAGISFRQAAQKAGLQVEQGFANALVAGAPGVGKTSLAQTLAVMLRESLPGSSKKTIYLVKAADLIDRHVGKSANNTKALLDKARDGIVIFDEIDTVMDVSHYGEEVLNTLNTHIGHSPNQPVIIATLYASREQDFRNFNTGLSSRFPHVHRLPSYGDDVLIQMFVKKVSDSGFSLTSEAEKAATELIGQIRKAAGRNFGFGREVDNIFNFVVDRVAQRYAVLGDAEKSAFTGSPETEAGKAVRNALLTITAGDVPVRDGVSGGFIARPSQTVNDNPRTEDKPERVVIPFPPPRPSR